MENDRGLWAGLILLGGAFLVLGLFGREVYRQAPPLPDRVVRALVWFTVGLRTGWSHLRETAPARRVEVPARGALLAVGSLGNPRGE